MENYLQMNFDRQQLVSMSPLGLAHVGDGVYDLLCRTYLCAGGDKTVLKLHKNTVSMVKASAQAKFADKLQPVDEKKAAKESRRKELYDARNGKKEDEIPQSEKDELFEIEKEITAAKSEKEGILAEYASSSSTLRSCRTTCSRARRSTTSLSAVSS